jgi:uncharacterized protein YjbI with pentapeptide repeats
VGCVTKHFSAASVKFLCSATANTYLLITNCTLNNSGAGTAGWVIGLEYNFDNVTISGNTITSNSNLSGVNLDGASLTNTNISLEKNNKYQDAQLR